MQCSNCGTENPRTRNVCIKCGNFIGKHRVTRDTDPKKIRKRTWSNVWTFIKSFLSSSVLIVLMLIIVGIIIFGISYWASISMDWPTEEELAQENYENWQDQENSDDTE